MAKDKHFKDERTFVAIKPDGVARLLVGEVIKRFERVGLKLVGMKMLVATADQIEKHYTLDPEWRRITGEKTIASYKAKGDKLWTDDPYKITERILENLKKYMTTGPIVAMVWEGAHAVKLVRKIVGGTEPLSSDVGTIRGDYVLDSYIMSDTDGRAVRNLVHASGSTEDSEKEIKHWFSEAELMNYTSIQEKILYDVNIDGTSE